MNRQVGPSIVLSVLIVCFFAVALFQHDRPRSARDGARLKSRDAIAGPPPALGPDRERSANRVQATASASRGVSADNALARAQSDRPALGESRGESRPATNVRSRAVSGSSSERLVTAPSERPGVARQPRAAFTVVSAAETIEDVAIRVYGSTGRAESLWRANRDALPRRDSPLSTGMVLRTPNIR
jgi:hypothetical protein